MNVTILVQHWTFSRSVLLVAYALGIAGALLLQGASYAFESVPFYDDANHTISKGLAARNLKRIWRQKWAMWLIVASFARQAASLCFE